MDKLLTILGDFKTLIIIYAPVILTYLVQIIDWVVMVKKLNSIDINGPLNKHVDSINAEFKLLKEDMKLLNTKLEEISVKYEEALVENTILIDEVKELRKQMLFTTEKRSEEIKKLKEENISLKKKKEV